LPEAGAQRAIAPSPTAPEPDWGRVRNQRARSSDRGLER
jgi:hypothetical protein